MNSCYVGSSSLWMILMGEWGLSGKGWICFDEPIAILEVWMAGSLEFVGSIHTYLFLSKYG